jgi:hypothetical protein
VNSWLYEQLPGSVAELPGGVLSRPGIQEHSMNVMNSKQEESSFVPTKTVLSHLSFETVCIYTDPGDRNDNLEWQEWCTGVRKKWVLLYVNIWLFNGKLL